MKKSIIYILIIVLGLILVGGFVASFKLKPIFWRILFPQKIGEVGLEKKEKETPKVPDYQTLLDKIQTDMNLANNRLDSLEKLGSVYEWDLEIDGRKGGFLIEFAKKEGITQVAIYEKQMTSDGTFSDTISLIKEIYFVDNSQFECSEVGTAKERCWEAGEVISSDLTPTLKEWLKREVVKKITYLSEREYEFVGFDARKNEGVKMKEKCNEYEVTLDAAKFFEIPLFILETGERDIKEMEEDTDFQKTSVKADICTNFKIGLANLRLSADVFSKEGEKASINYDLKIWGFFENVPDSDEYWEVHKFPQTLKKK